MEWNRALVDYHAGRGRHARKEEHVHHLLVIDPDAGISLLWGSFLGLLAQWDFRGCHVLMASVPPDSGSVVLANTAVLRSMLLDQAGTTAADRDESVALANALLDDPDWRVRTHAGLVVAKSVFRAGDTTHAVRMWDAVVEDAMSHGDLGVVAVAKRWLGDAFMALGDLRAATDAYAEASDTAFELSGATRTMALLGSRLGTRCARPPVRRSGWDAMQTQQQRLNRS